jgi:hypothetical protein
MPNNQRRIGFVASPHFGAVSIPKIFDLLRSTVPSKSLRSRAHLLSLSPPQSSFVSSPRRAPFDAGFTLPLGFWPSSRLHPCAATRSRRLPRRRFVPSSGFLDLSTFFSAPRLASLFHPAAASRIPSRSGASLPAQPPFLFGRTLPPGRCPSTRSPTCAGCRSSRSSASRLSSARGRVLCSAVIHSSARRSPLRVPLPQAPHFLRLDSISSSPPLSTFFRSAFAFAIAARPRPQRLSRLKPASRLRFAEPARAFGPFLQPSVLAPPTRRPLPCDDLARELHKSNVLVTRTFDSFSFPIGPLSVALERSAARSTAHRARFVHDVSSSPPARSTVARFTSLSRPVRRAVSRSTPESHDALTAWLRHAVSLFRDALIAWLPTP